MFAVIYICGNCFCGSLEKLQKLEPAKISCHTVYYQNQGVKTLIIAPSFS